MITQPTLLPTRGICSNSDRTFLWSWVPASPWYRMWPSNLSALLRAPSQRGSRTASPSRWHLQCPSSLNKAAGLPGTDGPVLAMCTDGGAADFIEQLVSAGVGAERLFVTAMLQHSPSDTVSGHLVSVGLPRLDAVLVRQQDIATLSMSTRASVLARLLDRGASVFITDAPRHVAELLDAVRKDPWNSSPIRT